MTHISRRTTLLASGAGLAALALAALAAGIALGATLRSTKTKEEMT